MDPEFVLTVCSACPKSISMNNSYGVTALHCEKVGSSYFMSCARVKNCPLGRKM
jgi:hypothetical protein